MSDNQKEKETALLETENKRRISSATIDFKMVTFTLAGKRYGIDILKVKEIRKAGNFTYVPNIQPFVRGVDNLRGEIISIIDMRLMFSLPVVGLKVGELENVIVLRIEDHLLGIVVDTVEKVVGLNKAKIRPPHPLFGDINIQYLSGIVEENGNLYVILNVNEIFKREDLEEESEDEEVIESSSDTPLLTDEKVAEAWKVSSFSDKALESVHAKVASLEMKESLSTNEQSESSQSLEERDDIKNRLVNLAVFSDSSLGGKEQEIAQSLESEFGFYLSALNLEWFLNQKPLWSSSSFSPKDLILTFYSPSSGRLWEEALFNQLILLLEEYTTPDLLKSILVAGCGEGHDAYSLACAIRKAFDKILFKIWAQDNDLMVILATQSASYELESIPVFYLDYMLNTHSGLQFESDIKDSILFEYSDITNEGDKKQVGFILAYDVLSFMSLDKQISTLKTFYNQLDENGLLIVGYNENVNKLSDSWVLVPYDGLRVYKKRI